MRAELVGGLLIAAVFMVLTATTPELWTFVHAGAYWAGREVGEFANWSKFGVFVLWLGGAVIWISLGVTAARWVTRHDSQLQFWVGLPWCKCHHRRNAHYDGKCQGCRLDATQGRVSSNCRKFRWPSPF